MNDQVVMRLEVEKPMFTGHIMVYSVTLCNIRSGLQCKPCTPLVMFNENLAIEGCSAGSRYCV